MIRFLFSLIVLMHGLIHLLGFVKAFEWAPVQQITKPISKSFGLIWLSIALLVVITATLYFFGKEYWWVIGIPAIILSQLLIIFYWQDAKFGTLANLIILFVSLPAFGKWQFDRQVEMESQLMLETLKEEALPIPTQEDMAHLPAIVQSWLKRSGVTGQEIAQQVWLQQIGQMKTKPDGQWMPFEATQRFNVQQPAFVWDTKVSMGPFLYLVGRDQYYRGAGDMTIKLLSLFKVVDEGSNDKINTGTMLRFLSETCWFPSAALSPYISWTAIDSTKAKATMHYEGMSVNGTFSFSEAGDFLSFSAQRYFGGGEEATLEKWLVEAVDHKTLGGYRIPYQSKVTWQLASGDFHWLDVEVTKMKINSNSKQL